MVYLAILRFRKQIAPMPYCSYSYRNGNNIPSLINRGKNLSLTYSSQELAELVAEGGARVFYSARRGLSVNPIPLCSHFVICAIMPSARNSGIKITVNKLVPGKERLS